MVSIEIVVFQGVDELDVVGPWEALDVARRMGARLSLRLVTLPNAPLTMTGNHGLTLHAQQRVSERPDILIVPGGGWAAGGDQGVRAQIQHGALPRMIANAKSPRSTVGAVCTGAMAVASAGLISGRPAVTHHRALEDLRASGAAVVEARVVDDGDVLTSGGVTSGIDLALRLIERHWGAELAERVAEHLEYQRQGRVHMGPKAG